MSNGEIRACSSLSTEAALVSSSTLSHDGPQISMGGLILGDEVAGLILGRLNFEVPLQQLYSFFIRLTIFKLSAPKYQLIKV